MFNILIGCSTPVKQFDSYYFPDYSRNLEIEVIHHYGTKARFELFIDKKHIMNMYIKMFDYHIESNNTYENYLVKMKGEFYPAKGFIVDVFINNKHAANFVFFDN